MKKDTITDLFAIIWNCQRDKCGLFQCDEELCNNRKSYKRRDVMAIGMSDWRQKTKSFVVASLECWRIAESLLKNFYVFILIVRTYAHARLTK